MRDNTLIIFTIIFRHPRGLFQPLFNCRVQSSTGTVWVVPFCANLCWTPAHCWTTLNIALAQIGYTWSLCGLKGVHLATLWSKMGIV